VVETSEDPYVTQLIQAHGGVVSLFVKNGFVEARTTIRCPRPNLRATTAVSAPAATAATAPAGCPLAALVSVPAPPLVSAPAPPLVSVPAPPPVSVPRRRRSVPPCRAVSARTLRPATVLALRRSCLVPPLVSARPGRTARWRSLARRQGLPACEVVPGGQELSLAQQCPAGRACAGCPPRVSAR